MVSWTSAMSQINTKRLIDNGRNAIYFEDYVLSMQYLNKVISIKPNETEAYYLRGIAKIQLEDYGGAEMDFSEAIRCNPFMPNAYYARGFARKKSGKYEDAEIDFNKALEFAPDNNEYILNRVEVQEKLKKYDAALDDMNSLIHKKSFRKNRAYDLLLLEMMQVMVQKGDTLSADSIADFAISESPKNPELYAAKGLLSIMQNKDSIAKRMYKQASELGSKNLGTYVNLGLLEYRDKRYDAALEHYSKALSIDSTDRQARWNRALLRSEVGDLNNAEDDLNILLSEDFDFDEALYQRAVLRLELRNYQGAKRDFETIMKKYSDFIPAYYGHAQACEMLGLKRQADIDRYRANSIEQKAMNGKLKRRAIKTEAGIAVSKSVISEAIKELKRKDNSIIEDNTKGKIQNEKTMTDIKKFFVISPYVLEEQIRKDRRKFLTVVEQLNIHCGTHLTLTNNDVSLSELTSKVHLEEIIRMTHEIEQPETSDKRKALLMTARGIDYTIVQNPDSAVNDFIKALEYSHNDKDLNSLIQLEYGVALWKQIEIDKNNGIKIDKKAYDNVVNVWRNAEDNREIGQYASFNIGNLYFIINNYKEAISYYNNAIAKDPLLSDAFYNRAIAKIKDGSFDIDDIKKDLSNAGEMGIYQAYPIIKQLTEAQQKEDKNN